MPQLKFTTLLPIPLQKAFELGTNLNNLKKIQPGFVQVLYGKGSHAKNQKFLLLFWQGLFPVLWFGKIQAFKKDELFTDTQVFGPFKKWSHTHRFEEKGSKTLMIDQIDYELWGGELGKWLDKIYIQKTLKKMFEGRSKKALEWLSQLKD